MKVGLLTREYPPDVYGGAGVHVEFLARFLRPLIDVDVHCWGDDRPDAHGHTAGRGYQQPALRAMDISLSMADAIGDNDLVHSHTWYANLAGHLAAMTHGIPHVITAHSLEPLRPWKAEQLGGGYQVSSWIERDAYHAADAVIAVSDGMRRDVLSAYPDLNPDRVHVVRNGIDTTLYQPDPSTDALHLHGVDPDRPYVLFVGRITRQKGVPHLVRAARALAPGTQLVLCAGEADTPELDKEFRDLVAELRASRDGVFWIPEMLPRDQVIQLDLSTLATLPTGKGPVTNAWTLDSRYSVVTNSGDTFASVFDAKTYKEVARLAVGQGASNIGFTRDGSTGFMSVTGANSV
ncbi:MAG TPA: glycogen synthase, partial [Pseudonocardiaceae bacterium]